SPGHQRMETPAIGKGPDAANLDEAVVQGRADPMQFSPVELPRDYAADIPVESDFLHGHVDMLPSTAVSPRPVCRHHAGGCRHIRMENAGIERFLHGAAVRVTRKPQRAAS